MSDGIKINLWRFGILVALVGGWEWLTGIKAISKTPGLYWIDPFFISRPCKIVERFFYLNSDKVRLTLWQMLLSTVEATFLGFFVGVSAGSSRG
jgi:ABC-type nitrate/sulfonate/bicarbonate transport system permease component